MIISRYDYTPLARESVEGKRHYALPDGSKVPSVTTILERTKPEEKKRALQEWRDRVGHERAQQITTEAANRGTRMHTYLERYVKSDDIGELPSNPFAQPSWFMAAQVILEGLQHADEYWGSEVPLYYSGLYAGTTDLVGVWKGAPAIMDFKQTNKPKKREWIEDYFLQLAAYAEAHNDTYGTEINTGVILMCAKPATEHEDPVYQEFVLEPKDYAYWRDQWMRRVELYYLTS
jgi:ATP-dependent exoDNAse (exonuclease V) beta subunit